MSFSWRTARGVSPSPQVFSRGSASCRPPPRGGPSREPIGGRGSRRARTDDEHVEFGAWSPPPNRPPLIRRPLSHCGQWSPVGPHAHRGSVADGGARGLLPDCSRAVPGPFWDCLGRPDRLRSDKRHAASCRLEHAELGSRPLFRRVPASLDGTASDVARGAGRSLRSGKCGVLRCGSSGPVARTLSAHDGDAGTGGWRADGRGPRRRAPPGRPSPIGELHRRRGRGNPSDRSRGDVPRAASYTIAPATRSRTPEP